MCGFFCIGFIDFMVKSTISTVGLNIHRITAGVKKNSVIKKNKKKRDKIKVSAKTKLNTIEFLGFNQLIY